MLRQRLIFGFLMASFFAALVVLDGWWDGSINLDPTDDSPRQAVILTILVALIVIEAVREFGALARLRGIKLAVPVATAGAVALVTSWFWHASFGVSLGLYLSLTLVASFAALLIYQYCTAGFDQIMTQCGAGCLALMYLGIMGSFGLAIRIEYGLWALLMFVAVIKASDIGAFTVGRLIGKHKFAPRVSPGKTWEGLGGAMAFASVVAVVFALTTGLMSWPVGILFGMIFAVVGQLGDLTESMFKRDAQAKDSAASVPGFGGVLDVLDSPVFAAPFVYSFFWIHSCIVG